MAVAGEACVSGVSPSELQALAFSELDQEWRAMPCLVNGIIVGYDSLFLLPYYVNAIQNLVKHSTFICLYSRKTGSTGK